MSVVASVFKKHCNCSSIENVINSFQTTLDLGIKFDNSINNKLHYEYIGDLYIYGKQK